MIETRFNIFSADFRCFLHFYSKKMVSFVFSCLRRAVTSRRRTRLKIPTITYHGEPMRTNPIQTNFDSNVAIRTFEACCHFAPPTETHEPSTNFFKPSSPSVGTWIYPIRSLWLRASDRQKAVPTNACFSFVSFVCFIVNQKEASCNSPLSTNELASAVGRGRGWGLRRRYGMGIQTESKGNFCLIIIYAHKTSFQPRAIHAKKQTFSNNLLFSVFFAPLR
jgi:hypothetical protein